MEQKLLFLPIISIVMPCYNNGQYVAQAIESAMAQTYENWELVIVNDGSTDNSDEVICHYAQTDNRIHYIKQENRGVSAARNHGVQKATGEYICFLDADDWLAPQCLEQAFDAFSKHPKCRLFYFKAEMVNEETGKRTMRIGYGGDYRSVLLYGLYTQAVMPKSAFIEVGGFDESMKHGFEDYEFYIRLLYKNCHVIESEDVLYFYRDYNSEKRVSSKGLNNLASVETAIYVRNVSKYVEYFGSPLQRYRYDDRFLPRLCSKILKIKATIYNYIKGL